MDSRKYHQGYSDERLSNTLGNHNINDRDFRRLKGTTWKADKTRSHAFTRGDVVTGWDHSTLVKPAENNWVCKSGKSLKLPDKYVSPIEAEAQFLEVCRAMKRKGDSHFSSLVQKYGQDGALSMLSIEKMPRSCFSNSILALSMAVANSLCCNPRIASHKRGKPTRHDLAAVEALDFAEKINSNLESNAKLGRENTPSSPDTDTN